MKIKWAYYLYIILITSSCIKEVNLYKDDKKPDEGVPSPTYSSYLYPFNDEINNAIAEIVIKTSKEVDINHITSEIPFLKFNKSWLLMLTQDDCKHAAYCRTWAMINGKPISNSETYPINPNPHELYYDAAQLHAGDLPPNIIPPSKTLGCTDGNGNEVRFAITTTLSPEWEWMDAKTDVKPGFTDNYSRFYMKSGLVWDNVAEMLNYGSGIAFHDVNTSDVYSPSSILEHYSIAQNIILKKLTGRGCKMLAEPNGNKTYTTAALQYPDIQTMTAQNGTVKLYPFKVSNDLNKELLHRTFDTPEKFKTMIKQELLKSQTEREAIHIGVHGTDNSWIEFLQWVNDKYGKDGDDSVWFPSFEEYYEYNYYRIHGNVHIEQLDKNTIKLIVKLPSEKYFYYPSTTINLTGIKKEDLISISSNNIVTGLSYGNYNNELTINIDCRKHLNKHATHFVEQYEKDKSDNTKKIDALYFSNILKESIEKKQLLNRIEQ